MPALEENARLTADKLGELARGAYLRGWALGTSGNFSAVAAREPLRLLITPSGVDKGAVRGEHMVAVDAGAACWADRRPRAAAVRPRRPACTWPSCAPAARAPFRTRIRSGARSCRRRPRPPAA